MFFLKPRPIRLSERERAAECVWERKTWRTEDEWDSGGIRLRQNKLTCLFLKSWLGRQRECQAFQRDDAVGTGQRTATRRPHARSSSWIRDAGEPVQWGLKTKPFMQKHTHTQQQMSHYGLITHSHKKTSRPLSIKRCHKQPFSSVFLSGTIKIPVTQAGLMLLLQSRRCYC